MNYPQKVPITAETDVLLTEVTSAPQKSLVVDAFHTCELRGDASEALSNAPFKSRANKPPHWQWLSQGYYFWTVEHFAHKWGKDSISGDYAIVGCNLTFKEDELLDLVNDFGHQDWLVQLINLYRDHLDKCYHHVGGHKREATVCQVIEHFRKAKTFPFIAVKAEDSYHEERIKFAPGKKTASIFLKKRQQICLFETGYRCITHKSLVFPII